MKKENHSVNASKEIITKVSKWGNSLGIRIPKKIVEQLKIEEGSRIKINQKENKIELERQIPEDQPLTMDWVIDNLSDDYDHNDYSLGKPMGREIW